MAANRSGFDILRRCRRGRYLYVLRWVAASGRQSFSSGDLSAVCGAVGRIGLLSAGFAVIAGLAVACSSGSSAKGPAPTIPYRTPPASATSAQPAGGSPSGSATAAAPSSSAASTTINITAHNIAFDLKTITIPAGKTITVKMTNDDSVPHNFAVYTKKGGTELFAGPIFAGPNVTKTFTFTAPSKPGTYYFQCDVHPTQMFGTLVVT